MAVKKKLGSIQQITDLREVWGNEAKDFTPWLAENIELLNEATGLNLEVLETESPVGNFAVDILAQDANTEQKAIIENQLEDTNHDHLGKLLTYAAGKEAKCLIWIVKNAREEHRAAIEYLNNNTVDGIGFFLIEIQLWSIDGSAPAVKFNVVEQPNDWTKAAKTPSSSGGGIATQIKYAYWSDFNDYVTNNRQDFLKKFNLHKPSSDHWYTFALGTSKAHMNMLVNTKANKIAIEILISESKELFDNCFANKESIEEQVGFTLDWRRLDGKKSSRILLERDADVANEEARPEQFDWMIDKVVRMKKAFTQYLK